MALPAVFEAESVLVEDEERRDSRRTNLKITTNPSNDENLLMRMYRAYAQLEARNPLLAKSLASAVIFGGGSLMGLLGTTTPPPSNKPRRKRPGFDWMEVASFTAYGALIGGPLGHLWDEWMMEHGPEIPANSMIFDQVLAQPPRLLAMAVFLDMFRAAVKEIPSSLSLSWNKFTPTAVARSWAFWPVATYLAARWLKKRRHFDITMKLCAVYWASQLAKRRHACRHDA